MTRRRQVVAAGLNSGALQTLPGSPIASWHLSSSTSPSRAPISSADSALRGMTITLDNQGGDELKAAEANFLKFLKRSDQLEVPIYQRTYSWTRSESLQLWSDVVRASNGEIDGHFIGSIVYIDTGTFHVTGANAIEIIDGQQRLTTISLLLLALARALEGEGSAAAGRRLYRDYLLQEEDEEPGAEARYKLLLTKNDRDTFMRM